MDLRNADGNEGNALLDRNIYLREIAKSKGCQGVDSWPQQPAVYMRHRSTVFCYWNHRCSVA